MDEENRLPDLPTGEELEARRMDQGEALYDLSENWLDMSVDYPSPRFLLAYRGVGFSPLGGIQAITGQKKNGKTFVMCQLMAAILGDGSEKLRAKLPGLSLKDASMEGETKVLYVDTEMEKENTARVARRVHWLCDWDLRVQNDRFRVLWLRAEKSAEDRWGKVKQAINEVKPTAIFLDGIRDVIGDFNDNAESASLISECMSIATTMNCCMWCVLHENPGSEKMRGHLGTELGNKVTDTFVSVKKKSAEGVTFTVKQQDARGKDVEDWTFEVTDDAGGLGIPRICGGYADDPVLEVYGDISLQDLDKAMKDAIVPPKSKTYTELINSLKKNYHIGTAKAQKWIRMAAEHGITHKPINGRITYNGHFDASSENGLPF